MNKNTEAGTQNKSGILHLLEYCRIDRAAELLGCEVCDLLHLAEVAKISLHWNFKGQQAICFYSTVGPSEIESGLSAITMDEPDGGLIQVNGYSYVFLDDDDCLGTNQQINVRLFGLWDAGSRFNEFVNFLIGSVSPINCESEFAPGRHLSALLPDGWQEPPVEELCIVKKDLGRLRDAMNHGVELDNAYATPSLTGRQENVESAANRQRFVTPNTCAAIMELLKAVGFSDKELSGSAQELQNKILTRGLSPTIASGISERTLRIWRAEAKKHGHGKLKTT